LAAAGAAIGCAQSKGALGDCYVDGVGVAKDVGKGLALGRESAAAGSCFGQCVVGWCYRNGVGVAQDYAEALRLYSLAAAQGYAIAQNNLGRMFRDGLGVAQDRTEVIRWFRRAVIWFKSHPALSLARPDPAFVAELTAHPLYCLASRSSVQRWEVMFRCRAPSQAHAQQWNINSIDVGLKQRSTLLARAALCELLVLRLMHF
jgi:hypothetical protein